MLRFNVKEVCLMIITAAIIVPLLIISHILKNIRIASDDLLSCTVTVDGKLKGNPACLQSQLLAITGSTRATMGAVAKAAPEISRSIAEASVNSVTASKATADAANSANDLLLGAQGAISELHLTITELHSSIGLLTNDVHVLLASSNVNVQKLGKAIEPLAALEITLDQQIKEQSPKIGDTLMAMQRVISDPNITDTLKHIDGTSANLESGTKHVSDITLTFDIATRGLRKKVGRIKWLLGKAFEMIKFTVPLL